MEAELERQPHRPVTFAYKMFFVFFISICYAQSTDVTINSNSSLPTNSTTVLAANDGSLQVRGEACTAASTILRDDYIRCFPSFPTFSESTDFADSQAQIFLSCICSSSWQAGSPQVAASTVPFCPAIPPLTKGNMAAVIASCAPGNSVQDQSKLIPNFGLRTIIKDKYYVPLSGLPVGVTSGGTSAGFALTALTAFSAAILI